MSDNNLALKLYEIEIDTKHLEEKVDRIETNFESHIQVTYDIKERLDKMDGYMPHVVETLKCLAEDQKIIKDSLMGRDLKEIEKNTEMRTKFKLLWKVAAFVFTTIAGVAVYVLQKYYL